MNLNDRIQKRYSQLGKSFLGLNASQASEFAQVIVDSHGRLGAFCQFCLAPEQLSSALAKSIITRWLGTIPDYLALPVPLLNYDLGSFVSVQMSTQAQDGIYAQCLRIAEVEFGLEEPACSEFANCIRQAASSSFAFYQKNQAPHQHSLEVLLGDLASYVQTGVRYGATALAILQAG